MISTTRLPVPTDKPVVPILVYHSQSPPCRPPDDDIPQDIIFAKDFICTQIANMSGLYASRSPIRMFCYNMLAYYHFENEHFRNVYYYVCGYLLFKQRKRALLDLRMSTVECVHQVLAMYTAHFCNNYPELMKLLTKDQLQEIKRLTIEFEDLKNLTRSVFEAYAKQSQQDYAENLKEILFKCKDLYNLTPTDLEQDCLKVHKASLEEPIVLSDTLKYRHKNPLQIKSERIPPDFKPEETPVLNTLYPAQPPTQPIHYQPQAMLHPRDQAVYQQPQQPLGYVQQPVTAPPGTQLVIFADGSQGFVPLPQGPQQGFVGNPQGHMQQMPPQSPMGLQSAYNLSTQQYQQPQAMQTVWYPDLPVIQVLQNYPDGSRVVLLQNGTQASQRLMNVPAQGPQQSHGERIANEALGTGSRTSSMFKYEDKPIMGTDGTQQLNIGYDRYGRYAAREIARKEKEKQDQQQQFTPVQQPTMAMSREEEMRLDYERRHPAPTQPQMTIEQQRAEEQRQYDERREREEIAKLAWERQEAVNHVQPAGSWDHQLNDNAVKRPFIARDPIFDEHMSSEDYHTQRQNNLIAANKEQERRDNINNAQVQQIPMINRAPSMRVEVAGGLTEDELRAAGYVKQTDVMPMPQSFEDEQVNEYTDNLFNQVMSSEWPDDTFETPITKPVLRDYQYGTRSDTLFPEDTQNRTFSMQADTLNIVRRTRKTHPESFIPLTPLTYAGETEMERSEHQIVRFGGAVRYPLKPKFEQFEQGVNELLASPMTKLDDIIERKEVPVEGTDEIVIEEITIPALDESEYAVYPNTLAEKSMDDAIFGSRLLKMEHIKAKPDALLFRTFGIISELLVSTADIVPMINIIKKSQNFAELATALRKATSYPYNNTQDKEAAVVVLQEIDRKIVEQVNRFLKFKLNVKTSIDETIDVLELRNFLVTHYGDAELGTAFDRFEREYISCINLDIAEDVIDDTKAKACISEELYVAYMPVTATFTHINLNNCDLEIIADIDGKVAYIHPQNHPNLYRLIANIDVNKLAKGFYSLEDYLITADGVCFRVYVNYTNEELYLLERV